MGLFGFGKKDNIIDLAERYKKQRGAEDGEHDDISKDEAEIIGASSDPLNERRKRLAKRILDITNRLDDLSNQIYHLQQRIEVLERKLNLKIE